LCTTLERQNDRLAIINSGCQHCPVTAKINIYVRDSLPQSFVWQSLSFMRCEWPSLFADDGRLRSRPFPATAHLAYAEGEVLLSYAEIISSTAVRDGQDIPVAGLSNVFTFPPYRREGLASEIVQAAIALIDAPRPEMAILFCKKELATFYSALGWAAAPAGTVISPSNAPLAMVRRPGHADETLVASLRRSPVTIATAW
jgi:predicted N-acetyltransferase YhbS